MNVEEEKTFLGKEIHTLEEFVEDLCDRFNNIYNVAAEELMGDSVLEQKYTEVQLGHLLGALHGLVNRLNRMCER